MNEFRIANCGHAVYAFKHDINGDLVRIRHPSLPCLMCVGAWLPIGRYKRQSVLIDGAIVDAWIR